MSAKKKALMCVFRPERLKSTEEMREWFAGSYHRFLEMDSVESKTWWVNQEKGEWGAFYIFKSEEALRAYVTSDIWLKTVPEKYGCTPEWMIVDPGPVLSKAVLTKARTSWISR